MGGNAFPDVGAIHQSEVEPTLTKLFKQLQLAYPHAILGSTGKKEFSGDIDIAIDIPPSEHKEFFQFLKRHFGDHDVRTWGNLFSTHFPIENYNSSLETERKRTGKVQVDFIPGNIEWLKFFYHSPAVSKLKGTHRNIAMSSLAGYTDRVENNEFDDAQRHTYIERYKWSPTTGFTRVQRTSRRHALTGRWIKKQDEIEISKPSQSPADVANILFKGKCGPEYLDSCEKVIEAINIVYEDDLNYKERIFKQMAWDLLHNHNIGTKGWEYPEEVAKHME